MFLLGDPAKSYKRSLQTPVPAKIDDKRWTPINSQFIKVSEQCFALCRSAVKNPRSTGPKQIMNCGPILSLDDALWVQTAFLQDFRDAWFFNINIDPT